MRFRLPAVAAAAAAALVALTACSPAAQPAATGAPSAAVDAANADLTLSTVDGEVTLDKTPERIVVFDWASLDTLHALGLDDRVVGTVKTGLPEYLSGFSAVEDAGTFFEPNFDAVANLNPDLIIISGRAAKQAPELSKIATTVNVAIDAKDFIASATDRAVDLAGLFGKQDEAQAKVAETKALVEQTKAKAPAAGTGLFVVSSGGKLSAYGEGSRFGLVYADLGFAPAAQISNEESHGQEISFEFISEHNPAHLFVMDRDAAIGEQGQTAAQVLDNDLVKGTDAAKNGKITYVDGSVWYLVSGGLTGTQQMVSEIAASVA